MRKLRAMVSGVLAIAICGAMLLASGCKKTEEKAPEEAMKTTAEKTADAPKDHPAH